MRGIVVGILPSVVLWAAIALALGWAMGGRYTASAPSATGPIVHRTSSLQ